MPKRIVLAITGASGALYAVDFLKIMAELAVEVDGLISAAGEKVLRIELGLAKADLKPVRRWYEAGDFTAPMASGSSRYHGMAVLPCTMGTLGAIAGGQSRNLLHRAADVMLKERRPLVLAVRETPLNGIHLKNMLAAHEAGAIICPAMPAFYHRPAEISDLARDFAMRVASLLGIDHPDRRPWEGGDV
ncbi:MAG: UbiX family flavin prenyltransferase [Deltaproteobacteria bacterium]|nr:UbiX family flavin prenyltransferase [Deltaproteobacteria bacterium]